MQVCLIRHAIAEDAGVRYPTDAERPLTADGRKKMERAAIGLHDLFVPEVILTSPLVRARQTADIVAGAWGLKDVRVSMALASGDHDALLRDILATSADRVACTGHEPWTSQALSYLLTGRRDGMAAVFKKGAAALVAFEGDAAPGAGWLEWLLQPAALRAISGGR